MVLEVEAAFSRAVRRRGRPVPLLRVLARPIPAILLLILPVAQGWSQPAFELFPGRKIFPLFTADGLQHTLSLTRVTENSDWIAAIGADVPFLQVTGSDVAVQAGIGVSTFNRLIKTPGHVTVYTVDYKVDLPLTLRRGPLALRIGYGHISCHLADDGIEIIGRHSIQSIKDYFMAAGAYDVPCLGGYVYGDVDYIYHIVPNRDKHWQLQCGGEGGNLLLTRFLQLYGAIDIKVKQQVGWGTTQSYQIGARFHVGKDLPLRISYTYRSGFDERGQFYDVKDDTSLIGLSLDF